VKTPTILSRNKEQTRTRRENPRPQGIIPRSTMSPIARFASLILLVANAKRGVSFLASAPSSRVTTKLGIGTGYDPSAPFLGSTTQPTSSPTPSGFQHLNEMVESDDLMYFDNAIKELQFRLEQTLREMEENQRQYSARMSELERLMDDLKGESEARDRQLRAEMVALQEQNDKLMAQLERFMDQQNQFVGRLADKFQDDFIEPSLGRDGERGSTQWGDGLNEENRWKKRDPHRIMEGRGQSLYLKTIPFVWRNPDDTVE